MAYGFSRKNGTDKKLISLKIHFLELVQPSLKRIVDFNKNDLFTRLV